MPQPRSPVRAPRRVRLPSRENTTTTTVILPHSLRQRAQRAVRKLNWTFGELIRVALDEFLQRHRVA